MDKPWYSVGNSWQYTTIYAADGTSICRFDLEDWGVNEDNQMELEDKQAALVSDVLKAVNNHDRLVSQLEKLTSFLADMDYMDEYDCVFNPSIKWLDFYDMREEARALLASIKGDDNG